MGHRGHRHPLCAKVRSVCLMGSHHGFSWAPLVCEDQFAAPEFSGPRVRRGRAGQGALLLLVKRALVQIMRDHVTNARGPAKWQTDSVPSWAMFAPPFRGSCTKCSFSVHLVQATFLPLLKRVRETARRPACPNLTSANFLGPFE